MAPGGGARPETESKAARRGATPRWPPTPPCRPVVRAPRCFFALGPWPDHTCLPACLLASQQGALPARGLVHESLPGTVLHAARRRRRRRCPGSTSHARRPCTAPSSDPCPRPPSYAPHRQESQPPEGLCVGARRRRRRRRRLRGTSVLSRSGHASPALTEIRARARPVRLLASSGDSDGLAAAVDGRESAGRAEPARVPPSLGACDRLAPRGRQRPRQPNTSRSCPRSSQTPQALPRTSRHGTRPAAALSPWGRPAPFPNRRGVATDHGHKHRHPTLSATPKAPARRSGNLLRWCEAPVCPPVLLSTGDPALSEGTACDTALAVGAAADVAVGEKRCCWRVQTRAGAFARGHSHGGERRCPGHSCWGLRQASEKEDTGRRRPREGARQCGQKAWPGREGGGCVAGLGLEVQGAGWLWSRGAEAAEQAWPKSAMWTPPPPKPPLGAALPRRPAGRQLCDVTGATKAPRRPTRASPTKLHQATRPTASGGRSRCLAAPGPSAPRRGAPPPPGHASASPRLAKALLHRALGQATSRTDRGRHSSASHPSRPLCIVAQLCVATQGAY
ncbi:uncharacterized protein DKFZp434B061-like [Kogia breviceps]|uniref:uncharacterized protein DKFZp434B061-like n=1 Tax=Kogia breviceps TaxID=27615 RepID=UPI0034D264BF